MSIRLDLQALRLNPEMADATSNLGNALKESGFLDEAIATYNQVGGGMASWGGVEA